MSTQLDAFTGGDSATSRDAGSTATGGGTYSGSLGHAGISSNAGYFSTPVSSGLGAVRVLDCGSTDQIVKFNINKGVSGNFSYFVVVYRYQDDNNYDCLFCDGASAQFYKFVSGSQTAMGSSLSVTWADNDEVKINATGTALEAFQNGGSLGTRTSNSSNNGTKGGWGNYGNTDLRYDNLSVAGAAVSTIAFTDAAGTTIATLPSNHGGGTVTIKAVATGFTFANPTSWSVAGVVGWSVSSSAFVDTTHYTIVLGCPAAASPPAGTTGTLTVTDTTDSVAANLTITTPTLSTSPTHAAAGSTPTLTLTGNVQLWADETASGLFTVSGGTGPSFATPTVSNNISATDVLTVGTSAGTLTITDTSTGATFSFTADAPAALVAGVPISVCTATGYESFMDGTNGSIAPTGGIAPYNYVWHEDTISNATTSGGNIAPGAHTSQNYSKTTSDPTLRFDRCVITDSAGSPSTVTTVEAPVRALDPDINILITGDSRNWNTPTSGVQIPITMGQIAAVMEGGTVKVHNVVIVNGSAPGSAASDWLTGSATWAQVAGSPVQTGNVWDFNWTAGAGSANLWTHAIALAAAAGVTPTHVLIPLGTNDAIQSVAPSTFQSRLASIIAASQAQWPGVICLICYPSYGRPAGSYGGSVNALAQQYQANINALVDNVSVFLGDITTWQASAVLTGFRQDDIHFSNVGGPLAAKAQIHSVELQLYPTTGSAGGSVFGG